MVIIWEKNKHKEATFKKKDTQKNKGKHRNVLRIVENFSKNLRNGETHCIHTNCVKNLVSLIFLSMEKRLLKMEIQMYR